MGRPGSRTRVISTLFAMLLAATALAGCHGLDNGETTPPTTANGENGNGDPAPPDDDGTGDDGDNGANGDTTPPPPNDDEDSEDEEDPGTRRDLTLTPKDPPGQKIADETSSLVVEVSGDTVQATTAGIRWATSSTAGTADEELEPSDLPGNKAAAGSDHGFPGEYSVTGWTLATGTYYVRAHIVVESLHYWSEEFVVEVVPEVEEGSFDAVEVVIGSPGLCNTQANYNDDPIEISVGEAIKWRNNDGGIGGSCIHSATHDVPTGDRLFDTGNLAHTETSASFRFNKPGQYEYFCVPHGSTAMSGTIIVTA